MFNERFRRGRTRIRPITDISLTPLIDTALTLLVIFMVASPVVHRAMRVQLPKGDVQEATQASQELVLYIDKHGGMTFSDVVYKKGSLQALFAAIKMRVASRDTLFVHADKGCVFGDVVELVADLKQIDGLHNVVFAMEPKHKKTV